MQHADPPTADPQAQAVAGPDTGPAASGSTAVRRRRIDLWRALGRPKVALMLALGFSSGLPFMLIGNTLAFWLAEDGIKLSVIGFLSWITLTYSVKFLWGAVADRLPPPLIGALGRRRGWMIITQLGVGCGLVGMALTDPRAHLATLVAFGLVAGVSAAAQDTVIDAWRIESAADPDELGLLTAAYSLGFRIALIATESWILFLADKVGWPMSYGLYGGLMGVGVAAALLCREPARADAAMSAKSAEALRRPLSAAVDAVVGPFVAFFRAHGVLLAALTLGMITLYHLCDYLRGPMSNPYYKALGIPKPTIGWVRTTIGLAGSFAGIALGGASSVRLGNLRTLVLGAILQPLAVAAFALLAWHGGDWTLISAGPVKLTAFEAIMGFDSATMAFSGVALVAYMSTLTSLGYTATQYALLTSALTWTGKTLKGFSGAMVEGLSHGRGLLEAYRLFYLLAAAVGVPAILLCVILVLRRPAPDPA
jgi:PAT family beta-lactamase induction signal transducer AmpG